MLKMYRPGSAGGGEPQFWEANWRGGSLEEALRFCERDPLRRVFETYMPTGSHVLEGGCGLGQYVVYYGRRGRRVVGLDFAASTLRALKRSEPAALLCRSDVTALPFHSESFDVYFSGGVVEHSEGGPQSALGEALRVLRPNGRFLVSVPYANPIRRIKAALGLMNGTWLRFPVSEPATRPRAGETFWQYAFTHGEFGWMLESSGFQILCVQPYAILWGLYEIPGVAWLARAFSGRRAGALGPASAPPAAVSAPAPADRLRVSLSLLLQRIFVEEDPSVPILGRLVAACAALGANMLMFVCAKPPTREGLLGLQPEADAGSRSG